MSGQSAKQKITSRLRQSLIRIFQVFIVLCLVDGCLDILYPTAILAKSYLKEKISETLRPKTVEPGSVQDFVLPRNILVRQEPGIRGIVAEYHSSHTNVAADGLRSNGQRQSERASSFGLLLGSSTAFGYGVADNQTLAAHLERALQDVQIDNYAGLAQPTSDNVLRWYDLQKKNGKPDFVVIAGASFQIHADCLPRPVENKKTNIILFLAREVAAKYASKPAHPCASSASLDLAVFNSILAIENAVAFGRKQGVPFYVVYLPTPYESNVNIDNLLKIDHVEADVATMQQAYHRYHEELAKLDLPEFIDLSHALPSDKTYFLDWSGHLSAEGNRILALSIAQHLREGKYPSSTRTGQDICPR